MALRVLIVDDSSLYRKVLRDAMAHFPEATAVSVGSGTRALDLLAREPFDLVFLDIHMPELDGVETLRRIKTQFPLVMVVMISGISNRSTSTTVEALQTGAMDFIRKPEGVDFSASMELFVKELRPIMRLAEARLHSQALRTRPVVMPVQPRGDKRTSSASIPPTISIVAIGVSTGGPEALNKVVPALPADFPLPVVVVQHMPPGFTRSLAESLTAKSKVRVKEGEEGESLSPGVVYIAPGGRHMTILEAGKVMCIGLNDGPPENSCRPSVDVLFRSVSACYGNKGVLAAVLTGMGSDGLNGVRVLKRNSCYCITQSPETCVVYGMPRAIDEAGLSDLSISIDQVAPEITRLVTRKVRF